MHAYTFMHAFSSEDWQSVCPPASLSVNVRLTYLLTHLVCLPIASPDPLSQSMCMELLKTLASYAQICLMRSHLIMKTSDSKQ